MAKMGRPRGPKRDWEKLTVLLTVEEMRAIDETAERMTKANADGTQRTWSRSDVVRRWLTWGAERDAEVEAKGKKR